MNFKVFQKEVKIDYKPKNNIFSLDKIYYFKHKQFKLLQKLKIIISEITQKNINYFK